MEMTSSNGITKQLLICEVLMLDKDGYPTDETLDKIKNWDPVDFHGLMEFIQKLWKYHDYFELEGNTARVSTGGWSGNESLLDAIPTIWKLFHKYSWRRGGHYVFTKNGRHPEGGK